MFVSALLVLSLQQLTLPSVLFFSAAQKFLFVAKTEGQSDVKGTAL